ncbi:hypothetical protein LEP1GSC050_0622 [Leptospira broomii serovar Hurstbridge str. 5399]|uniref:Uncharacterized protein n=1 Tax=Leptospira broomii serovar Hurstbridge str. 5399 TaxID=1049789 RepID=T0GN27_9LEPT|nr:hypothetical protein LEP1GSC050_0622 [Leptospira broomii serovar Hurstbridge str. 5399]
MRGNLTNVTMGKGSRNLGRPYILSFHFSHRELFRRRKQFVGAPTIHRNGK